MHTYIHTSIPARSIFSHSITVAEIQLIYMHTYMHIHMHTYIHTSILARCIFSHIITVAEIQFIYIHTYTHAYIHTYINFGQMHPLALHHCQRRNFISSPTGRSWQTEADHSMKSYIQTYIHIHTYPHTHTYIYIYMSSGQKRS